MDTAKHAFSPEEVMALLDGELTPQRAAAVATHVESCSECRALTDKFRGLSQNLATWYIDAAPAGVKAPLPVLGSGDSARTKFGTVAGSFRHRYRLLIWTAGLGVATIVMFALATPNLLRSRMAANEASAVGSLRTINTSAARYMDSYGHYPPSLKSLGPSPSGAALEDGAGLIDNVLAQGLKSGYFFSYNAIPASGYRISALPVETSKSGVRRFFTDQSGIIRAEPGGVLEGSGDELALYKKQSRRNQAMDALSDVSPQAQRGSTAVFEQREAVGNAPKVWTVNAPLIARSVSLSIVVKDFAASRNTLDAILTRSNGYAANLTVSAPQESAHSLQASLRIPAPRLTAAVNELKALGSVETETQNGEEVTQQHADLVARLKNSAETEQRLQAILQQRTGKVADVLSVEQEIARVRGEIEQMEAEQKNLEHRVDFATVELKLSEEYKAQLNSPAPSVSTQLHNALVNGYRNVADTLLSLILFFAEYGPVLLLWCVFLMIPAYLVWRRLRAATASA